MAIVCSCCDLEPPGSYTVRDDGVGRLPRDPRNRVVLCEVCERLVKLGLVDEHGSLEVERLREYEGD